MWYRTRNEALMAGLRAVGRAVDPERLEREAKNAGIDLPIMTATVSAPSLGSSTQRAYQVPIERQAELRAAVDRLMKKVA